MEMSIIWVLVYLSSGLIGLRWVLSRVNSWLYETQLGDKRYQLPPGDLGWPFVGNMWAFLRAFKSSNPDSFINSFVARLVTLNHLINHPYKTVLLRSLK